MQIVYKKITDLKKYEKNNKKHPEKQLEKIVASIKEYGFNDFRFCKCNNDYVVTDSGEVLSVCKTQYNKKGELIRIYKTKLLNGSIDRYGYKTVRMFVDGKKKHVKVHRLIAGEFLENNLFKPQVNHKDMNKLNNCIENLEWVTDLENKKHYNLKVGKKWKEKGVE